MTAAPSEQQKLIRRGAHLFVSDGCSACHAIAEGQHDIGPSFARFAGNRVSLSDGRTVLVDEAFLRRALSDPTAEPLKGYPLLPMVEAVRRLDLSGKPADIRALAVFIEQIGPE